MDFDHDIAPRARPIGYGKVTGFIHDMPIGASAFFSDKFPPESEYYRRNPRNFSIGLYTAARRAGMTVQTATAMRDGLRGIRVWRVA